MTNKIITNNNINTNGAKKVWSKPRLMHGKGIGFLGLGNVQTGSPYSDFS